ncbi:hypothetical protein DE146DRAFT_657595 [Phaeosphaeria sp. MPI-PUGE-AT-0046c]|nr:hypothetical protein DE146DRAFT_657595 [Phaeosphaeria sp. MPI-PUGE-AT-0046c]
MDESDENRGAHSASSSPSYMEDAQDMISLAPTMTEIIQLTREQLTTTSMTDPIRECGRAAQLLLPANSDMAQELAYQNLHTVPYKDVRTCWRRLYTDATLWKVIVLAEAQGSMKELVAPAIKDAWLDEVVKMLDMALILSGAPEREELVELWFSALKPVSMNRLALDVAQQDVQERPSKRRKFSPQDPFTSISSQFEDTLPGPAPALAYPIPRTHVLSMSAFQTKLSDTSMHTPVIIEGALQHWPALDERPWNSPSYLLDQTLGGRRLVPVEIGRSYTDEGWGQKIISFKDFMSQYMLTSPTPNTAAPQKGYLAQHDLFAQIPSLRADISIPDYCYCSPAPSPHLTHIKSVAELEEPLLNAWFGPAGTVSPLHTDPYHNILAQVVGYKYVRLYAPSETSRLYPRDVDENGIDMSNTSQVDLDEAMRAYGEVPWWEEQGKGLSEVERGTEEVQESREEFKRSFPNFWDAPYVEGILGPGECLYLPVGWWHYVRSLTGSFSVSFWFN